MSCTLGVDIGTYQTKAALVDAEGRVLATAARDHEMIVPRAGWAEHRAEEDWWGDFVAVTRAVLRKADMPPKAVKAVACSAIGPCMLPVDAADRPLMNAILYGVDTRAAAEIGELTARIGEQTLVARCGNALTSQSVGPKILWFARNRPEIWGKTARVLTSTSYLVAKLTGEHVIDHYTAANFTPLYDIGAKDWCHDLAPGLIAPEALPRLLWSGEVAGEVTREAAEETGLAAGTPVTAGTIDAAAEAVSVGLSRPGEMMVMYGSTIFIITLAARRLADGRLWAAPWMAPGAEAAMAGLATSGTLTHWFRDNFARELDRDGAFAALAAEAAESPPGANGLLFLPYFSGERTPIHDPAAKGTFFGLNLTHRRGDLYRALLEGIAHGTNHVVDTFAGNDARPERLLAVGGGVKNPLWLQATSDITGLPQTVREVTLGASFGDAFLAAQAAGLARPADIEAWNPVARTVEPAAHPVYPRHDALFRRLYLQTRDIMAELDAEDLALSEGG